MTSSILDNLIELDCPIPDSVHALQAIKPGQRIVYYKGNLAVEAARSGRKTKAVLRIIMATAEQLANDGRVKLGTRHRTRTIRTDRGAEEVEFTAYEAIGL
jgi:hypothetical protein